MRLLKQAYRWCAAPCHLFVMTIVALALPNIALCITERTTVAAKAANILLPVSAYWLAMTMCRKPGRSIWALFVFIFFAAFQLVLLYLFGHSIIAVDMFLNLVTTNPGEVSELLHNLVPAVAGVFVIYLPLLTVGGIEAFSGSRLSGGFMARQRRYALAGMAAGVAAVGWAYAADKSYSVKTGLYPLNVCYNLKLAAERTYATAHYAETSAGFRFGARPTHPADSCEVYVLVVGETARAMNFSIYGYHRNTTPLLAATKGIVAFGNTTTQSNTTHKSVPMLLSAASAQDYNRIYREKSVITAFREAGFHTTFISNQLPNHSFIDIFGKEAHHSVFIKENAPKGSNISDNDLLGLAEKALNSGHRKQLLVLHTYGSHFNYRERYGRNMAAFTPDNATEAKPSNRRSLINAYDNTILNTDRLLHRLIGMLSEKRIAAALIYTSDHGENVFDDRRNLFLHASPIPSYYELHVPLIVWTSSRYRTAFAQTAGALAANKDKCVENSKAVFHTMLQLAGISTPLRADSLSVASSGYRCGTRLYLNDHNLPVGLDALVTDSRDMAMFRRQGVSFP